MRATAVDGGDDIKVQLVDLAQVPVDVFDHRVHGVVSSRLLGIADDLAVVHLGRPVAWMSGVA